MSVKYKTPIKGARVVLYADLYGYVSRAEVMSLIDAIVRLPFGRDFVHRYRALNDCVNILIEDRKMHIFIQSSAGVASGILLYPFSIIPAKDKIIIRDITASELHLGIESSVTKDEIKERIDSSFRGGSEDLESLKGVIGCPDEEGRIGFYYTKGADSISLNYMEDVDMEALKNGE